MPIIYGLWDLPYSVQLLDKIYKPNPFSVKSDIDIDKISLCYIFQTCVSNDFTGLRGSTALIVCQFTYQRIMEKTQRKSTTLVSEEILRRYKNMSYAVIDNSTSPLGQTRWSSSDLFEKAPPPKNGVKYHFPWSDLVI